MNKKTIIPVGSLEKVLSRIKLIPITDGQVSGKPLAAGYLYRGKPVLIFVIRRPGCIFCREQAQLLIDIIKSNKLTDEVQIIGVVKQVAPVPRAPTDKELGIDDFQKNYFDNNPIYLDPELDFFKKLGYRSVLNQKWTSWNPFTLWNSYRAMNQRINNKKITGNLVGEGLIQGGIILLLPGRGVKFIYHEVTGMEIPRDSILAIVQEVIKENQENNNYNFTYTDADSNENIEPVILASGSPMSMKQINCSDECGLPSPRTAFIAES
jgi:hypothetical protein